MSKVTVECPLRKQIQCGNPCGLETRATQLAKEFQYGSTGSTLNEAYQRVRRFGSDTGCPPKIVTRVTTR
jgi:hypothetical protein